MCTNLPDCWVGALSEGLRGGDIGGFMDPRKPTDPKFYAQVAYTRLGVGPGLASHDPVPTPNPIPIPTSDPSANPIPVPSPIPKQVAYQLSFWAIVITILLNVIFGIIIDTFGNPNHTQPYPYAYAYAYPNPNPYPYSSPSPNPNPALALCLAIPFRRAARGPPREEARHGEHLLRVRRRPLHPGHQG